MGHEVARLCVCVGIVLCSGVSARAGDIPIVEGVPPGFELVRLTDDPTMEHSVPDINDCGEVVFGKFVSADAIGNIYRFSGGLIRQLTDDRTYDLNVVTNNVSQIAWLTCLNSDGPFPIVGDYFDGDVSDPTHPSGFIDMNNGGDIVWKHRPQPGVSEFDIYLYTHADGKVTRLTNGGNNQSARINNRGDVVWRFRDDSVSPWISRILVYSNGTITDITPGECQCQGPDINDLGHVTWTDNIGLRLWDGESVTLIAELAATARINNNDEIAFGLWDLKKGLPKHAIFKDGTVYVLPNFGFSTARTALNNRGEIAMRFTQQGHEELFLLLREGPKGDGNYDCQIDKRDFRLMQICRTALPGPEGPLLADCIRFDLDDDGDVDQFDFEAFLDVFTGPDDSVPNCEP